MSTIYDDVVRYAKQIKTEKSEGKKWIYFKNNKVYLIDKLPNSYYQKTVILIVDDPVTYLKEINKREPTKNELDQFKFIGEIIPLIDEKEEVYLPNELWEITIMNKPIKEILEMRSLSKEWKDRIDSLWCKLIERDYGVKQTDNCYEQYKLLYNMPKIYIKDIEKSIKKFMTDKLLKHMDKDFDLLSYFIKELQDHSFKQVGNILYFDPKAKIYKHKSVLIRVIIDKEDEVVISGIKYLPILGGGYGSYHEDLIKVLDDMIYSFLSKPMIIEHGIISIKPKDFKKIYEKLYGKNSLNKELLNFINTRDVQRSLGTTGKGKKYEGFLKLLSEF